MTEQAEKDCHTIIQITEQFEQLQSEVDVLKKNAKRFNFIGQNLNKCFLKINTLKSASMMRQQQEIADELNGKLQKSFNKIATLKRSCRESSIQYISTVLEKEKLCVYKKTIYFTVHLTHIHLDPTSI